MAHNRGVKPLGVVGFGGGVFLAWTGPRCFSYGGSGSGGDREGRGGSVGGGKIGANNFGNAKNDGGGGKYDGGRNINVRNVGGGHREAALGVRPKSMLLNLTIALSQLWRTCTYPSEDNSGMNHLFQQTESVLGWRFSNHSQRPTLSHLFVCFTHARQMQL